jgi:hypothetical protein
VATHARGLVAILALISLLAACSGATAGKPQVAEPTTEVVQKAAARTTPSPPPPARQRNPIPARFRGTVTPLPHDLAAQMHGTTWHAGCPVPLSDLRLLTLRYWGFHGHVHEGRMVINDSVAEDVVSVFRRLFEAHFPIRAIHLAHKYRPGHDDPNDRRDYTAGFNCRPAVTAYGPRSTWSQHAYGLAIDLNPIQNPYVASDGYIHNIPARRYRDRSLHLPGMIHAGDVVVSAFAAVGWEWGGYWSGDKDYMHFSLNGN